MTVQKSRTLLFCAVTGMFAIATTIVVLRSTPEAEQQRESQTMIRTSDLLDQSGRLTRAIPVRAGRHLVAFANWGEVDGVTDVVSLEYLAADSGVACVLRASGTPIPAEVSSGFKGYTVYRYYGASAKDRPEFGVEECTTGSVVLLPDEFPDDGFVTDDFDRQAQAVIATQGLLRDQFATAAAP